MAVVGTIVFASFQRPAQSQSTSPAFTAGASPPSHRVATSEHIEYTISPRKGSGAASLSSCGSDARAPESWRVRSDGTFASPRTGQYAQITGGGGRFPVGGHQATWYARLFGRVSRPGAAKQRVLITLKGRRTVRSCSRRWNPGCSSGTRGRSTLLRRGSALIGTRQQRV